MMEIQVRSLGWEDPLEKEMATHPGKYYGQRSLVAYSPQHHTTVGQNLGTKQQQ